MATSNRSYRDFEKSVTRLVNEYQKYQSLFVAFDFDNTVYDYHKKGLPVAEVVNLLRKASQYGDLICFTCNGENQYDFMREYFMLIGLEVKYFNENPIVYFGDNKPYYNILLDDRAGLDSACAILEETLRRIENAN